MRTSSRLLWAAVCLSAFACSEQSRTGRVQVFARGNLTTAVSSVSVDFFSASAHFQGSFTLTQQGNAWIGAVGLLPPATDYEFDASAYDTSNPAQKAYASTLRNVTIVANQTAMLELVLQPVTPPPPQTNHAPVIDGISVSTDRVAPGATANVTVTAHDPDPNDTLTYLWTTSDGGFVNPASPSTTYNAPSTAEVVTLTITVTDSQGAKATQSFTLIVGLVGSAQVSVTFNDWPVVQSLAVSSSPVAPGHSTQVTAVAVDPDGDALTYAWAATCQGGFDNAANSTAIFTVSANETATSCTLTVNVNDGHGGSNSGTLVFGVGEGSPITVGGNSSPALLSVFESASSVGPSDVVTLRVAANDGQGGPVSYSWHATAGSFDVNTASGTSSQVQWTAPPCLQQNQTAQLSVTLLDPATQHTFEVGFPMSGPGTCMTQAGTNSDGQPVYSAPVGAGGASIASGSGVALSIPSQAVTTQTNLTVETILTPSTPPPPEAPPQSAIYAFGPAGTVFAHPLTVRIPLPPGFTAGSIWWQQHNADGSPGAFAPIGGTVQGNYLVAQISHFSDAYIGPASTSRTVSGSDVTTYQAANRAAFNYVPQDLLAAPPAVLVWNGAGYDSFTGTAATDGTFSIGGVPAGEYMLQIGSDYVVTTNDTMDLGRSLNGRPKCSDGAPASICLEDLDPASADEAQITFNLANASPYQVPDPATGAGGDLFEFVSSESEICWFDFYGYVWGGGSNGIPQPNAGDTSFAVTLDFRASGCDNMNQRFQGSKGDTAAIGQAVDRQFADPVSASNIDIREITRIVDVAGFDMQPGGVNVAASFLNLPGQQQVSYSVAGGQFTSFIATGTGGVQFDNTRTSPRQPLPDVAPGFPHFISWATPYVDVEGQGGGASYGQVGATLDLAFASPGWDIGDYSTGPMTYGVPAGNWGIFTGVGYSFLVGYRLPCAGQTGCPASGYTQPGSFGGYLNDFISLQFDTSAQPSGAVGPQVSPVRAAQINGLPLSAPHTNVGTAVTVSWNPPALGVPDEYTVSIHEMSTIMAGGQLHTKRTKVASFTTPHTSLVVPAGLLQAGHAYVFQIIASRTGLASPLQTPHRQSVNNAGASVLSDVQWL